MANRGESPERRAFERLAIRARGYAAALGPTHNPKIGGSNPAPTTKEPVARRPSDASDSIAGMRERLSPHRKERGTDAGLGWYTRYLIEGVPRGTIAEGGRLSQGDFEYTACAIDRGFSGDILLLSARFLTASALLV